MLRLLYLFLCATNYLQDGHLLGVPKRTLTFERDGDHLAFPLEEVDLTDLHVSVCIKHANKTHCSGIQDANLPMNSTEGDELQIFGVVDAVDGLDLRLLF